MMAHAKSRQHPTGYRLQAPGPPHRKWCKKRNGSGCRKTEDGAWGKLEKRHGAKEIEGLKKCLKKKGNA